MLGCPRARRYLLSVCECAFLSSKAVRVETLRWWFLVWCGQVVKLKPTGLDSKLTDSVSPGKAFFGRPPHKGKRPAEALLQRAFDGIPRPVHVPYLASLDPYPNLLNSMVHWGGNVACWWDIRRKCVKRVVQAAVRVFVVFTWSASSGPPEASGEWAVWAEVWLRSRSLWCSLDLHDQSSWKFQEKMFYSRVSRGWDLQVAVLRIRMPSRALSWMSVQNNQLLENKQNYVLVNIVISLVCFLTQVGPCVEVLWHKLVMKVWSFLWTELELWVQLSFVDQIVFYLYIGNNISSSGVC